MTQCGIDASHVIQPAKFPINLTLADSRKIGHHHRVHQNTCVTTFGRIQQQYYTTWVPSSPHVTGNHGDYGLFKTGIQVVRLDDQCRAALCSAKVRVRKKHEHNIPRL